MEKYPYSDGMSTYLPQNRVKINCFYLLLRVMTGIATCFCKQIRINISGSGIRLITQPLITVIESLKLLRVSLNNSRTYLRSGQLSEYSNWALNRKIEESGFGSRRSQKVISFTKLFRPAVVTTHLPNQLIGTGRFLQE